MLWLIALACSGDPTPAPPIPEPAPEPSLSIPLPSDTSSPHQFAPALSISEPAAAAQQTLTELLKTHALKPNLPWAIGHALIALGPSLQLTNGRDAVAWLFSEYATRVTFGERTGVVFPERKQSTVVQPHPSLFLKAFADSGVNPSTSVTVEGQPHTVADLYTGTLASTWFDPATRQSSMGNVNEMAWALFGLSSWSTPETEWTDARGRTTALSTMAHYAAQALATDTLFIEHARAEGKAFRKRGQGIFQYTCGGAHLIQGVIHAQMNGIVPSTPEDPFSEQLKRLMYRFPIELAQIDQAIKTSPSHAIPLAVQRLKLTGHTLETLGRMGTYPHPESPGKEQVDPIVNEVVRSVEMLEQLQVFENLAIARTENHQMFLDVVGDSAHALRGLAIVHGQQSVRY